MDIAIVGVDLSKSVFQLSLADANHHVVDRKRLSRAQFHRFLAKTVPVRLVMEACGTSNYYWGRSAQLQPMPTLTRMCRSYWAFRVLGSL